MEKTLDTSVVDARRLMRSERTAVMATRGLPPQFCDRYDGESDDWPYASLVEVACDHDGCPILLLSELAVHTSNISRDARISLLFNSTRDTVSPLTQTRLTVSGIASKTDEPRHRSRFLARHPEASDYAGFTDFNFWHVAPMGVHVIIGFGRIFSIPAKKFLIEPILATQFSEISDGIIKHMNGEHGDAVDLIANNLLGCSGTGWQVSCCDPEGMDLRRKDEIARLEFGLSVFDSDAVRAVLIKMTQLARSKS